MASRVVAHRSDTEDDDAGSQPNFQHIQQMSTAGEREEEGETEAAAAAAATTAGVGASPLPAMASPSSHAQEDDGLTDALLQIQHTSSPISALDAEVDATVVLDAFAASSSPEPDAACSSSAVAAPAALNRHGIAPLPLSSITAATHVRHASATAQTAASPPRHGKRLPSDGGGGGGGVGGGVGGLLFLPPVQIHGIPASVATHTRSISRQLHPHSGAATLAPSAAGSAANSRAPSRPTSAHRLGVAGLDQQIPTTGRLGAGPSELPDGLNSWRGTRAGPIPLTGGAVVMSSGSGAINLAEALFNKLGLTGDQSRRASLNKDAAESVSPPNTGRRVQIASAVLADESKVDFSRLRSHGSDAASTTEAAASAAAAVAASAGAASAAASGGHVTARAASERRLQLDDKSPPARRTTFGTHLGGGGGGGGGSSSKIIPLGRVGTLRQLAHAADSENGASTKSKVGSRRSSKLSNGSSDRYGDEDGPAGDTAHHDIEGLDEADARTLASPLGSDGESVDGDEAIRAAIEARKLEKKPISSLGLATLAWIDGGWGTLVMTVATIFCLFGDDIRLMAFGPSADLAFVVLSLVCLVLFSLEFAAFCTWREGYRWTFFFFLDLVAVFSLIPDLPFIWEPFMESIGQSPAEKQNLAVARAGRASRAGTRAGRLVRFIRLVRFLRLGKLYKLCGETEEERLKREAQEQAEEAERARLEREEKLINEMDSDIGKGFSDYITKCVIIMVLFLMFLLPLLEVSEEDTTPAIFVQQLDNFMEGAVETMRAGGETVDGYSDAWAHAPLLVHDLIRRFLLQFEGEVLHFHVWAPGASFLSDTSNTSTVFYLHDAQALSHLRAPEISKTEGVWSSIWMDVRANKRSEAMFSLCTTIFVTVLLAGGSALFSKDAHQMVILPIERMFLFVVRLAANPLGKIEPTRDADQPFETRLLESTFMKLAGLLQIGFGMAGAEIISHNMQGDFLDPMVPGRKIFAIFGFCDIRQFGVVTEALGQHVMIFVNQIADILHELTHAYGGAANKNIGSAFLLVWKPTLAQLRRIGATREQQAALASASTTDADPTATGTGLGSAGGGGGGGGGVHGREKYTGPHLTHTIAEGEDEGEDSLAFRQRVGNGTGTAAGRSSRRTTTVQPSTPLKLAITQDLGGNANANVTGNGTKEQWAQPTPRKEQVLNETGAATVGSPIVPHERRGSSSSSSSRARRRSSHRASTGADAGVAEENNINIPSDADGSPSTAPQPHPVRTGAHVHGGSFVSGVTVTDTSSPPPVLANSSSASASSFLPALTQPRYGANPAAARLSLPSHLVPRGSISVGGHFNTQTHAESSSLHPSDFLSHENGVEAEFSELASNEHPAHKKRSSGIAAWDGAKADSPSQQHQQHLADGIASNSSMRGSISLGSTMTAATAAALAPPAQVPGAQRGSGIAAELIPAAIPEVSNLRAEEGDSLSRAAPPQHAGASPNTLHVHMDVPLAMPASGSAAPSVPNSAPGTPTHTALRPPPSPGLGALSDSDGVPSYISRNASLAVGAGESRSGPLWEAMRQLADQAMVAFLSTIREVALTQELAHWRSNPSMVKLLGSCTGGTGTGAGGDGVTGGIGGGVGVSSHYDVDMGFGLHVGWAIEGAIGSIYKVDPSYLSPHVNIASRLCGASKQYGVRLLLSGPMFSLLQPDIQKRCRHLDRITVKGSKLPLDIYTFDVGPLALRPPQQAAAAVAATSHPQAFPPHMRHGSGYVTPIGSRGGGGGEGGGGGGDDGLSRPRTPPASAVSSSALLMPPPSAHHVLDLPRSGAIHLSAVATREPGSCLTGDADIEVDDANNPLPRMPNSSRAHAIRLQEQTERLQARTARRRSNPTAVSNSSKKAVNSIAAVMGLKKEAAPAADGRIYVAPLRPTALKVPSGNKVVPSETIGLAHANSNGNLQVPSGSSRSNLLAVPIAALDPMVELQALSAAKSPVSPHASASSSPAVSPRPSRPTSPAPRPPPPSSTPPPAPTTGAAAAAATSAGGTASVHASSPGGGSAAPTDCADGSSASLSFICAQLQLGLPADFVRTFNEASHYYIQGKWARARDALENRVLKLVPGDKAARVLLDIMAEHKFKAPKDWPGYRALTAK